MIRFNIIILFLLTTGCGKDLVQIEALSGKDDSNCSVENSNRGVTVFCDNGTSVVLEDRDGPTTVNNCVVKKIGGDTIIQCSNNVINLLNNECSNINQSRNHEEEYDND